MLISGEDLRVRSGSPSANPVAVPRNEPCTGTGDGSEAISSYQTPAASVIRAGARSVRALPSSSA